MKLCLFDNYKTMEKSTEYILQFIIVMLKRLFGKIAPRCNDFRKLNSNLRRRCNRHLADDSASNTDMTGSDCQTRI